MQQNSSESGNEGQEALIQEEYITDPHIYLEWANKNKKIKVMDECNPIMPNVYLKDISLHKKGPLEDKIYSKNDKYYYNIRRGNTLCQIYDENQKQAELFMCRRGMKKFYDLEPEFLKLNRNITYKDERFRKRIFEKLDRYAVQGYKIHLYSLFKENGQHCQISYLHKLQCWLFASKNVAILARNSEDLENHYHKQRFYWAKLIGKQFFNILKQFTPETIKQFIRDIQGKTLLGEHCGYQEHQHITKYNQIQIIFYALIENNGNDHCMPVRSCENFLKKYNLKMSRMEKVESLGNKNEVYENMYRMLKQVAEGTMNECGQGSVLYIVAENQNGVQTTIGMCKLKTCQYLIFRRIRQMIKIYFAKKGETANNFQKFKFDIQNLCANYFKPPKQLKYYYSIAEEAFAEVKNNQKDFTESQFRYKFVNFIDNVMKNQEFKEATQEEVNQEKKRIILLTVPLTQEENTYIQAIVKKYRIKVEFVYRQSQDKLNSNSLNILHMVPRINLETLGNQTTLVTYKANEDKVIKIAEELDQKKDLTKSHLITFLKSPDKVKSLTLLSEKIDAFQKNLQEKQLKCTSINNLDHLLEFLQATYSHKNIEMIPQRQHEIFEEPQEKRVFVIMTMSIPGSGKSSIAQKLQQICEEKQYLFRVISSDKIRQKVMEKFKKKNPGMSPENAYQNTKKQGLTQYRRQLFMQLEEYTEQKKIIFIDRVFCPTTVFENIQEMNQKHIKFIIVTQNQVQTKLNDHSYPLSLDHLLVCLKRSLQRQEHETLSVKPEQIVRVILKFYQMYRDYKFTKLSRQLKDQNISFRQISINFTVEKQNEGVNLHLKRKIEQCLKQISPGHQPPQSPCYGQLITTIYKYPDHIERKKAQENEEGKEKTETIMESCIKILEEISKSL